MNKAKEGLYLSMTISLENIEHVINRIHKVCEEDYYQKSAIKDLAREINLIVGELREIEEELKIQDLDLNQLIARKELLEVRIMASERVLDEYSHEDLEYQIEKQVVEFLEIELDNLLGILEKRGL